MSIAFLSLWSPKPLPFNILSLAEDGLAMLVSYSAFLDLYHVHVVELFVWFSSLYLFHVNLTLKPARKI